MKKIFSCFTILVCFLVLGNVKNVYAAEIDTDDISNSTYVIGKCMFTRDVSNSYSGSLSTDVIMLAAKTIESNNLEDMIIYYKNARGVWVNALTNETIEIAEKINIEYKNNEVYIETPILTNPYAEQNGYVGFEDGKYIYDLAINFTDYCDENGNTCSVVGYEVYEKEGANYKYLASGTMGGAAVVEVEVGTKKTLVARVYQYNASNEKVYSEYSNELTLDNSTYETPILTNPYAEQNGYVGFEDGKYIYDLAINFTDYCDENGNTCSVVGYEVYEKEGANYKYLASGTMGGAAVVEVEAGTKKTLVARVYQYNTSNEKVYSAYSNEVVVDNSKVETPTLTIGHGSKDIVLYTGFTIGLEGYYTTEDKIVRIDGWELYEKVNNQYTLVEGNEVEVDIGQKKTYVARAYALNKDNEKVYSEYSNEVEVDNSKIETPTLTIGHGSQDVAGFTIGIEGYYVTEESLNTITSWELYEKVDNQYTLVNGYEVEIIQGETKTYVARAYALNKNNEKVYSAYSNEVVLNDSN